MKTVNILSYSDVITNSSSEVFVIANSDVGKLPEGFEEFSYSFVEDNILDDDLHWVLGEVKGDLDIPEALAGWDRDDFLEKLREHKTDKEIIDFFKPLLEGILDHTVISICDENGFNIEKIDELYDFFNNHREIKVEHFRV